MVKKGLIESREKAQRLIRAGKVRIGEQPYTKPGQEVDEESKLQILSPPRFVGRGGEKIAAAIQHFNIRLKNKIALDIGASTGGFTDCILQQGALKVYAVDVGQGLLDWKLQKDSRVAIMDRCNARYLTPKDIPEKPEFCSMDVSFISLEKIMPAVHTLLAKKSEIITLIKPQFEAGREQVQRGGVIKDPAVHKEVLDKIKNFGIKTLGWYWMGMIESPIKGPAGNIEFLAYWKN